MNRKEWAKKHDVHIATVYRKYPVHKPQITQAQVLLLTMSGYSIRQVAAILTISKSQVHRLCS